MKCFLKVFTLLCLSVSLFACSSTKDKSDEVTTITFDKQQETMMINIAKDLCSEDFDHLKKSYPFDTKMKEVFTEESFLSQMSMYAKNFGAFKSNKEAYAQSYQGNKILFLPIIAEKQKFNLQLSINDKDEIIGLFIKGYLEKPIETPAGLKETSLSMKIENGGTIQGMLTTPEEGNNVPVIVMLSGSGPNDMNESIGANKVFQDMAYALGKQGIATYRFDKRTKDNAFSATDTIKQEYVDDALAALELMKKQTNLNTSRIYLLGHSQGGYILPRIAKETTIPAGYIFMSSPARPLEDIFVEQVEYLSNLDGIITKVEQREIAKYKAERKVVKNIEDTDNSITPFGVNRAYMLDLKSYDPLKEASSIKKPVLVTQGLRDYQVTQADLSLWQNAFRKTSNWTFKTYQNANHLMIDGTGKPNPDEYQIKGSTNASFIEDIKTFIN